MGLRWCTRAFSSCGGKAFHCGRNRRQASSGLGGGLWRQASAELKRPSSRALGPGRSREVGPPNFLERPAAMRMRATERRRAGLEECGAWWVEQSGHREFCGLWSWWAGRQWRQWGLLCGCGVPRGVAGEDRPGGCALARIWLWRSTSPGSSLLLASGARIWSNGFWILSPLPVMQTKHIIADN